MIICLTKYLLGIQVVTKTWPIEEVLNDMWVQNLYVDAKECRLATHSLLRTIVSQMETLWPKPMSRSKLPLTCHVHDLQSNQTWVAGENGEVPHVRDDVTGEWHPV